MNNIRSRSRSSSTTVAVTSSSLSSSSDGYLTAAFVICVLVSALLPSTDHEVTAADVIRAVNALLERIYVLGVVTYLSVLCYNRRRESKTLQEDDGQRRQQQQQQQRGLAKQRPDDQSVGSYVVVSPPESQHDAELLGGDESDGDDDVLNLTGTYKLAKNVDFDKFLEAQGIGWALRSAANKAKPVHKITHRGKTIRIQISGIITGDTTYRVNGPPVTSQIRDRIFSDTVQYLDSRDGIRVHKVCQSGGDGKIVVTRQLSSCRREITMRSKCVFDDGRESVEAVQIFERID